MIASLTDRGSIARQLAGRAALDYHGRTMTQRRAGKTVKVSVSLDVSDLATLKALARDAHGGNLSAAFSEAAALLRQRAARRKLVRKLGGPSLTPEAAAAIDAEQAGGPRYEPRKRRRPAA